MQRRPPIILLTKFVSTMPQVKKELRSWAALARQLPEPLRTQALASLELKAFHCIGGSIYAHYPGVDLKTMLPLIVAFQTISEYLDNLCDRLQVTDPEAFRLLHKSVIHALSPGVPVGDYYALYPYKEDQYLPCLVQTCQSLLAQLPHYENCQTSALRLAEYYCELQTLKHISPGSSSLLPDWAEKTSEFDLEWNEWAAACGSTLGIFMLFALAYRPTHHDQTAVLMGYFPWIQGLHILLDYLIDMAEDEENGDLNFMSFYPSAQARELSLCRFAQESWGRSRVLPEPKFHQMVVAGLIALYGSDRKVDQQDLHGTIRKMAQDKRTLFLLTLCRRLRRLYHF
jgi:tetraprenyl-beta-curcumene synthase